MPRGRNKASFSVIPKDSRLFQQIVYTCVYLLAVACFNLVLVGFCSREPVAMTQGNNTRNAATPGVIIPIPSDFKLQLNETSNSVAIHPVILPLPSADYFHIQPAGTGLT
ncbi:hypothetical protein AWENTII_001237 [Aspergillus wentii]